MNKRPHAVSMFQTNKKNLYSDHKIDTMCIKTRENKIICFPSTKKKM